MTAKNLPNVGDVIMSPKFAYGYYGYDEDFKHVDKKRITIDGNPTEKHQIRVGINEDERVTMAAETGKIPPKKRILDYGACDPSRATAKFVVESAAMGGGGTGHGAHDVYGDGWHIRARRLNKDGSFDPNGEVIGFYMTGSFTCMVEAKDIKVVSKMKMIKTQTKFV